MQPDTSMKHGYLRLLLMAAASFAAMYGLMYMMVDGLSDVYANVNQLYMAAMMTAPMVVMELILMRSMYSNRRANVLIMASAALALVSCIFLIRNQIGVSDREFLRSMIPHHSAAVFMCEKASPQDSEIKELCQSIVSSQEAEITWMRGKLDRL